VADVGDGDDDAEAAVLEALGPDRVVVVPRVGGVDGAQLEVPQVLAGRDVLLPERRPPGLGLARTAAENSSSTPSRSLIFSISTLADPFGPRRWRTRAAPISSRRPG
jgi:hypothetical protein